MALSKAEKQRQYRERKKRGCVSVRFNATPEEIEDLIDWGVLPAWSSGDPEEIGNGIHKILAALRGNAFEQPDLVENEHGNESEFRQLPDGH
ncbi:MAG: hypothetical protein RIM72_22375 [Alphaproteobacteria bacterium]